MKFTIHHNPEKKALSIPYAALQLSGLNRAEKLILHTVGGCTLVSHPDLNATEMVETIQLLTDLGAELIRQLAEVTQGVAEQAPTECDACGQECGGICIPGCMLEAAGIEPDAPLDFTVEDGAITFFAGEEGEEEADPLKKYGEGFCMMLSCAGVDIPTLCRMLEVDIENAVE